jgi:hypothetical protein
MTPLRELRSLTERYEEDIQAEPLKRYYLIFEGANTEKIYFKGIQACRKEIGISNYFDVIILIKENEIRNYSDPKKLLELIEKKKEELLEKDKYDKDIDQFVLVFDRDSFHTEKEYLDFLTIAGKGNILTITSPCFELWLILHFQDAIPLYIQPNLNEILVNENVSKAHSYTSKLFSTISGMNPKKKLSFQKLKQNICLACEQKKELEQDNEKLYSNVGSNVGILISQMQSDPRDSFLK